MILDPTNEIKSIRHRLGAEFDYDLDRIFADIQRRQEESGRTYITMPPRGSADAKATRRSGGAAAGVKEIWEERRGLGAS